MHREVLLPQAEVEAKAQRSLPRQRASANHDSINDQTGERSPAVGLGGCASFRDESQKEERLHDRGPLPSDKMSMLRGNTEQIGHR